MDRVKYIVVDDNGMLTPIVFPNLLTHADVAKWFKVHSAGFVQIDDDKKVHTFGESISLGVKSDKGDAELIQKYIIDRA